MGVFSKVGLPGDFQITVGCKVERRKFKCNFFDAIVFLVYVAGAFTIFSLTGNPDFCEEEVESH